MTTKVVNLFGGPGTGKSTSAAHLFAELKMSGVNCEYVQEYAKDKAWELGKSHTGIPKVFQAQEYIFGKQHFRFRRCAQEVDMIIADCPLVLGLVYIPEDFELPSLRNCIREAFGMYDNLNIFLERTKDYNPAGRFQTEDEAKVLDKTIRDMLDRENIPYHHVKAGRDATAQILELMKVNGWSKELNLV
jgi:nicotinamide riboside kinase